MKRSTQFISPQKSRQLSDLADRAKISLSRYAGIDVEYNAIGLQLLDEWIERHSNRSESHRARSGSSGCFPREAFRRRYQGQWGTDRTGPNERLGIICPRNDQAPVFIDVMDQIAHRIREGMEESLAFYYTIKGIEITPQ